MVDVKKVMLVSSLRMNKWFSLSDYTWNNLY